MENQRRMKFNRITKIIGLLILPLIGKAAFTNNPLGSTY